MRVSRPAPRWRADWFLSRRLRRDWNAPMTRMRGFAGMLLAMALLTVSVTAAEPKISFTKQIKPILASRCLVCHGPDEKERKADLRLDVRDMAVPAAIKPGDAEHSELIYRVTTDDADLR